MKKEKDNNSDNKIILTITTIIILTIGIIFAFIPGQIPTFMASMIGGITCILGTIMLSTKSNSKLAIVIIALSIILIVGTIEVYKIRVNKQQKFLKMQVKENTIVQYDK